jgi:molybdopterin converting factor small subunit
VTIIEVNVEWFAPDSLEEGKSSNNFELVSGSTITDLIKLMVKIHGEKARLRLLQDDGVTPYVNFIVAGKIVPLDYALNTNTVVMVLPPIYGG